jgi:hypothetical protein
MKICFLDDSHRRQESLLGLGGFFIDDSVVRAIGDGLKEVKMAHGIPTAIEIKWSPNPRHYLRTHFRGHRPTLYRDVLGLLRIFQARVLAVVHLLSDCHGIRLYNWSEERILSWAAHQQLKFVAERFQRPGLTSTDEYGVIICDQHHSRSEEEEVLRTFDFTLSRGTEFIALDRILMNPLMAPSITSPHIQIADVIIGVIVGALAGSGYALELLDILVPQFLWNPHERAVTFCCTYTSGVIGYGLKVFPLASSHLAYSLLSPYNARYTITNEGLCEQEKV